MIYLISNCRSAGVNSRIEIFDYGFHDFQIFTDIPEAQRHCLNWVFLRR